MLKLVSHVRGSTQRVFINGALRRVFEPKRDEVTGGPRKLHFEELHCLNSYPSSVKVITSKR
jgi:hypothetical protein